ncbi:MAG: ABC transporter substrate-binding protein [Planctomycetota bacterium]
MRAVTVLIIAAVAALLVLATRTLMPQQKPIELGIIGSLTGRFSALGTTGRDGAMLAVEQLNAAGGIHGRRIELHVADDGGQTATAVEAMQDLSQTGIQAIIGPLTSACAEAIRPLADDERILVVTGTASSQHLAETDDFLIRLHPSTARYGSRMSELLELAAMRRIATIHDTNAASYAQTIIDAFTTGSLAARPELAFENLAFTSGFETDHEALAEMVLDTRPDTIFIVTGTLDCALLLQFIRATDPEVTVLTSPWAISNELVYNSGQAIDGLLFALPYRLDATEPAYLDFLSAYRQRFGREPDHTSLMNYECVRLLNQVWHADPGLAGSELRQAILQRGRFQGVQQPYTIDAHGDADRPLYPHTYHDGRIQALP